ncbi:DinB family protein [Neobacillus sp. SuZ13]|uniref:DinB family protein n=1 Tax=Neobacillus sp. SuZ13 TaxID=3047875 RepID=UPI0024BF16A8|nr:DinB family protein [Neobacillus sp. SuZ13]WHY69773.1 DinB family protein [Neobacillus sp. SuZ13]
MNTMEALQKFKVLAFHYLGELDNFSMEQLKRQPSEDEWSIGQMYQHLINSALYMHLRNIDHCIMQSKNALVSPMEKTREGAAIFEQNGFPPIRIKVPHSPQYTPVQPESKEQLIQGLNTVIHRMEEAEPKLQKAPKQNTVSHPRFGALHAKEWFLLIEMHFRHHLLQLDRLKKDLERNV